MPEFIFMLTRDDLTVPDARQIYGELDLPGLRHVGLKDVGLPETELTGLAEDIRGDGRKVHIEVVSETSVATMRSAEMATRIGADYLLGGTLIEEMQQAIAGSPVKFFPYVGEIVGHPCLLRGSIQSICEDVRRAEGLGVSGINLLAYRYDGAVEALVEAVCSATSLPVLCAGSIQSERQIRTLAELGIWGFTVGTAALDLRVVPDLPLTRQIETILSAAS